MRIERTKNTIRSVIFGFGYRVINIILPFASRTAILYILGEKYLGLSSLFTSILSFLSLAEMGMGAAVIFSMYEPIAQNDKNTLCCLLNYYKRFYRIIGLLILGLGLLLIPFLPKLITGSVPTDINLQLLYVIYLLNTVISYLLFAYKQSIVQAYQRNDVISKIGIIITPISYVVMIAALVITQNYYAYVIWMPVFTIVTNIMVMLYVNKHYPDVKPSGDISTELRGSINKKVKALIGTKLNTVVINAADNIVMAAFLGLTTIAVYGNYYYILSSIVAFLGIVYSSMTAGIGNSLVVESLEKNYNDFLKFSFINAWLVGWCAICLACLYQPFMMIWVGESLMFPIAIMLQMCLYFYIYQIRKIPVIYKDAAGIWWEDRFRPYVTMLVNLVLNIVLVQHIGVSGIIISTIVSLMISIPWENYTIFKYVFLRSSKEYYVKMILYASVTVFAGFVTFLICKLLGDSIGAFLVRGIICIVVPNAIFVACYRKKREFNEAVALFKRIALRR